MDVWVWSTETCSGSSKLYAPQQTWDSLIGFGLIPWDIVWDYSVYPPTYRLLKNGSPTDTKTFNFNGAFIDAFNPNPPDPIGALGCGKLEFVGYLCDKQGTEKCDPDEAKGEECLCMREQEQDCPAIPGQRFCEDCDTLSDFVAGLSIIGYGTRPAGFDDLGYGIVTNCEGKRVWLGRGWYNGTSWDINQSTNIQPYPKYINIADDCCDDQCIVEPTPTCAQWLAQNPPTVQFVQGSLPSQWTSRYPSAGSSSAVAYQVEWGLSFGSFSYVWDPVQSRMENFRLECTVTCNLTHDDPTTLPCQTNFQPPFLTQQYVMCTPPNGQNLFDYIEFCGPASTQNLTLRSSPTTCGPPNPPGCEMSGSDFCCIDFGGIEVCQYNVEVCPNMCLYHDPGNPVWPPPYGSTTLIPIQMCFNSSWAIRPGCNESVPSTDPDYIRCNEYDSADLGQFGYLLITMPDGPPECNP